MSRLRLWLHDKRLAVVARYWTWQLFRSQPWREAVKRRTP